MKPVYRRKVTSLEITAIKKRAKSGTSAMVTKRRQVCFWPIQGDAISFRISKPIRSTVPIPLKNVGRLKDEVG